MKRILALLLALTWGFGLLAQEPVSIPGLSLEQMLIGEEVVDTGREQLVEVTVRNSGAKDLPLIVRLVVTLPNRNIITYGNKHIIANAYSDTRALIPYPLGQHDGGDYTVAARVFNRADEVVLTTTKVQEQIFYGLDRSQRDAPPEKRRQKKLTEEEMAELRKNKEAETLKASDVSFDPPDLKFSQVTLINASVLRGETTHVRMYINNDGGNVAANATYSLYWFFSQRPNRKVSFFRDRVDLIAPGERKVLEVPLTIPATEQQGKYQVLAVLDEGGSLKEMDETNNQATTDNLLIFGDVALVFPDNNYSFAEEGLFQFEWRSKDYNQFKLQISADPTFTNDADSFYLPKGDLWTPSFKINPMKGEMPQMGIGLMETREMDHLFWRVVAKNSQGKVTESASRKFYITLKPKE
ncbi:MAG: CARDB domain-containing protein [bacterium]|nr:CARDB domain-containing protein [bacterium]